MDTVAKHNSSLLLQLERGDLVEFPRGVYSHWAVYIGNDELAHLAGEDDDGINAQIKAEYVFTISGVRFNKAKVCLENFWNIVEGCKARKNNSADSKYPPLPKNKIVKNATSKLGEVGYSLMYQNCEHFAKWCRYGVEKSDQVDSVLTGVAVGFATLVTAGLVWAGVTGYQNSSPEKQDEEEEEEQNRRRSVKRRDNRLDF